MNRRGPINDVIIAGLFPDDALADMNAPLWSSSGTEARLPVDIHRFTYLSISCRISDISISMPNKPLPPFLCPKRRMPGNVNDLSKTLISGGISQWLTIQKYEINRRGHF